MTDEPGQPSSDDVWATTGPIPAVPSLPPPDGSVVPPPPPTGAGPSERQKRRTIIIAASSLFAVLVIGVIVVLSLSGDDPESISSVTTVAATTTTAPITSTTLAATPTLPVTAAPSTTMETTTTTVASSVHLEKSITVANESGIYTVGLNESTVKAPGQWGLAFTLPDGTFIAQRSWPSYRGDTDSAIYLITPTGATEPLIALNNPTEEALHLHDVYQRMGTVYVLYSIEAGMGFEEAREELFEFSLDSMSPKSLDYIGGWESSTSRLTYGDSMIVGEYYSEAMSGPLFLSLNGIPINPNDLGLSDTYVDCSNCPRLFTTDRTGTRVAWYEPSLSANGLVVVFDVPTGRRIAEVRLPTGLPVASLELFGTGVLVNLSAPDGFFANALVLDFTGGSAMLPTMGLATLTR